MKYELDQLVSRTTLGCSSMAGEEADLVLPLGVSSYVLF